MWKLTSHDLLPGFEQREADGGLEPEPAPPEEGPDRVFRRTVGEVDAEDDFGGG